MMKCDGYPFARQFANLMWKTWQARASLAQQAGEDARDGWQPIETAPKDGTEILLWREDCGQFIGAYTSYDAYASERECEELDEASLFQKDWFGAGIPWGMERMEGSDVPTHWMPLPPPPAIDQAMKGCCET